MAQSKRTRLADIASATGLSVATVSRYMNGKSIRPQSAQLIREYLNSVALKSASPITLGTPAQSRPCIGVLIPELSELFYAKTLMGIFDAADNLGYHIVLDVAQRKAEREQRILKRFSELNLQGLVYAPLAMTRNQPADELQAFSHLPVVVLNRRNLIPGRVHVYTDNIRGGYVATKYLLSCGRKRIGIVLGTWNNDTPFNVHNLYELAYKSDVLGGFTSADRFRGYVMALKEHDIPYDPALLSITTWETFGGIRGTSELLGKNQDIDGIIYTADVLAAEGIEEIRRRGKTIPDDISIVGWSKGLLTRYTTPVLSTVDQRYYEAGYSSVMCISHILAGEMVRNIVFDPMVVPGESTSMKRD